MKPAPFEYEAADSIESCVRKLNANPSGAKILSGGQSLGPMMNLRLARPSHLVDISGIEDIRESRQEDKHVLIGAATTHAEIEDGCIPDPLNGMMRSVAAGIAYRAVRNKGTIGGSLAHADPAADWVNLMVAANALIHVRNASKGRIIPASEFVIGAYTTTLKPDEVISRIEVPRYSQKLRWGYYKFCRKVGEFADAIGVVLIDPERRYCRVVAGAVGGRPVILNATSQKLAKTGLPGSLDDTKSEIKNLTGEADAARLHLNAVAVLRAMEQAVRK
ncbi:MAG: FAD binding domain-containing protein [Fimbriimonadaceae bacterium]|nr:FAD binding domain-containing protein [Alphaproteobacteria bacterium]